MNFFKRIDNYLLHHYPSIWVTRVHIFFPIGLLLIGFIYGANRLIGWNPQDDLYGSEEFIFFMIIPILIYLIYWFIFQSRYNVLKSKGKLSIFQEYLSFSLYFLVFFTSLCFILIIPFAKEDTIKAEIGILQLKKDITIFNRGNTLVNEPSKVKRLPDGRIEVRHVNRIDPNNMYGITTTTIALDEVLDVEQLTEREVLQRIDDYLQLRRKYIPYGNRVETPQEILANVLDYDPYDGYYDYDQDWSLEYKLSRIYRMFENGWFKGNDMKWFWRISLAIIGMLSMIVWIFKQMNLRHFVFGLITLCLTPILIGLVALFLFEVIDLNGYSGELFGYTLILLTYVVIGIYVVIGAMRKKLNQTAYVLTWYIHFWIPVLPLFIFLYFYTKQYYLYSTRLRLFDTEETADFLYWSCIILGLISIMVFKPIYTKFRSLPMAK